MSAPSPRQARYAVAVVFAIHGAATGSFATRIPWLADRLHTGTGGLGTALIFGAIGAVGTMPLAGRLAHRYRSRTIVRILMLCWCVAVTLPMLAPDIPVLCVLLLGYGACAGLADVAMNAQGVEVERRYGKSIMSGLHGMWSVGGLVGSGFGALAAHAGLDARVHLAITAAVLAGLTLLACPWLLDVRPAGGDAPAFARPSRRVLLVGLVGFCAIFAEMSSSDWCAVYLRDVTGADPGTAATAYTGFALAMAAGRLSGDGAIRRFGAVATVRLGAVVATAGGALVLAARTPVLGIAGFALIGLGIAVVVPLAFATAGRIGPNPGHAIAGIATISYGAGMAAPAAVGGIASASSLPVSFAVVTGLCVAMGLGATAMRQGAAPAAGTAGPSSDAAAPAAGTAGSDTAVDTPVA